MAKKNVIGMKLEADWQTEDDMRTLMRAREIKNDPKRYAKACAFAKQKLTELAQIAGSTADE